MAVSDYRQHIIRRVTIDHDILTYRLLSRELGITVGEAREALQAVVDEKPTSSEYEVVWYLTGTEAAMAVDEEEKISRTKVHIVPDAELSEQESRLEPESIKKHIYALTPSKIETPSQLAPCSLLYYGRMENSKTAQWKPAPASGDYGGINHPEGSRRNKKGSAPPAAPVQAKPKTTPVKAATPGPASAKKTTASGSRPIGQMGGLFSNWGSGASSSKKDPPPKKEVKKKTNGTLSFGSLASSSKPKTVPQKRKEPEKPKAKAPQPKTKANGIFAEAIDSDEEGMYDDDIDMDAMDALEETAAKAAPLKATPAKPKSPILKPKPRAKSENNELENLLFGDD